MVKKGDIVNIVNIKDAYRASDNDVEAIVIEAPTLDGSIEGLKDLKKQSIFSIETHEFNEKLSKYSAKHYTLRAEKIRSIAFPENDDDIVRINGSIDIPLVSSPKRKSVTDTYFLDEQVATSIAVSLNEVELERLEELEDLVKKAVVNLRDVCENRRV